MSETYAERNTSTVHVESRQ